MLLDSKKFFNFNKIRAEFLLFKKYTQNFIQFKIPKNNHNNQIQ
jgi:hypothetical protein